MKPLHSLFCLIIIFVCFKSNAQNEYKSKYAPTKMAVGDTAIMMLSTTDYTNPNKGYLNVMTETYPAEVIIHKFYKKDNIQYVQGYDLVNNHNVAFPVDKCLKNHNVIHKKTHGSSVNNNMIKDGNLVNLIKLSGKDDAYLSEYAREYKKEKYEDVSINEFNKTQIVNDITKEYEKFNPDSLLKHGFIYLPTWSVVGEYNFSDSSFSFNLPKIEECEVYKSKRSSRHPYYKLFPAKDTYYNSEGKTFKIKVNPAEAESYLNRVPGTRFIDVLLVFKIEDLKISYDEELSIFKCNFIKGEPRYIYAWDRVVQYKDDLKGPILNQQEIAAFK